MARILIVSPFSGRGVGGGLAVMNQELTKAFADEGFEVRLLTMELPDKFIPDKVLHGNAEIIFIRNERKDQFDDLKSKDDQRNALYELINSDSALEDGKVVEELKKGGFKPDIIIGHSRFSGPAAVKLKQKFFPKATVEYFLHSYPIEGSILAGHEAYDEPIDAGLASAKLEQERLWMEQADVSVGVGPLLRYGATLILGNKLGSPCRVHECIPGTSLDNNLVQFSRNHNGNGKKDLLMSGRANAPIKGLEDLLLAAMKVRKEKPPKNFRIRVRGWQNKVYSDARVVDQDTVAVNTVDQDYVQRWAQGVLGLDTHSINKDVVEILPITPDAKQLEHEIREAYAVLMPSYAEHFGLAPFDAIGLGVPVLMSEFSGAAMFLGDKTRFGDLATEFIVHDFGDEKKPRPLNGADFLTNVAKNSFDRRPDAWKCAIEGLLDEPAPRLAAAKGIWKQLASYTWAHCAHGLLGAAGFHAGNVSKQGPEGRVLPAAD
jgi:glycosyltransferase involved in cell wall biosynthesis